MDSKQLPDFICIGSQRSGTTWLFNCLQEHPQILLPKQKELHYFDLNYDKGIEHYLAQLPSKHCRDHISGDITPNYYQAPLALERIKKDCPNSKIIYVLREPIARVYSQYQLFSQSKFKNTSFSKAIRENELIIDLSLQGKHLNRVKSLFSDENVLILFYDDIQTKPQQAVDQITDFLHVKRFVPKSIGVTYNKVVMPSLQEKLAKFKLAFFVDWIKKSPLRELVIKLVTRRKVSRKDSHFLQQKFASDIHLIEQLTQVNLSHWKQS